MKMKQLAIVGGLAVALLCSINLASAQDNPPGGGPGGGGGGGGGGGRGNFDPAQFMQRMMDNIKDQLEFTNDADWDAVQPLVQKVIEARRDAGGGANMMRLMRPNRGGNGGGNRRGGFGGPPNPDAEALQRALDDNAPAGQVKTLLVKYQTAMKAKQASLKDAQEALRAVLTSRQEAQATLMGLLD
jgi:hypothetical protein